MQYLKLLADELKFTPRIVCEVGVGDGKAMSQVKDFIEAGASAILLEPLPRFYRKLIQDFAENAAVQIHNCAIYKENGDIIIYDRALSTFVRGIEAPTIINDNYVPEEKDALRVTARTFDNFDDGSIDLLAIDAEGCEFYVLEKMRSRPGIICLETTGMLEWGHQYVNPMIQEITRWMQKNEYCELCKLGPDTVFLSKAIWGGLRPRNEPM